MNRNAADSRGQTALHIAALAGNVACTALLLGRPGKYKMSASEIDAVGEQGGTALHLAATHGHVECCGLLVAAGAAQDATMPFRSPTGVVHATPLQMARMAQPNNRRLIQLLSGADATPPGTCCAHCGTSEAATSLRACSGCLFARFCCDACAVAAWPAHKLECRRLKARREEIARAHPVG